MKQLLYTAYKFVTIIMSQTSSNVTVVTLCTHDRVWLHGR